MRHALATKNGSRMWQFPVSLFIKSAIQSPREEPFDWFSTTRIYTTYWFYLAFFWKMQKNVMTLKNWMHDSYEWYKSWNLIGPLKGLVAENLGWAAASIIAHCSWTIILSLVDSICQLMVFAPFFLLLMMMVPTTYPPPASLMFLCLSFGSAEPTAEQLNEWFL